MAKKKLTDKQLREHINQQQRSYRQRHPELTDLWRAKTYARFLQKRGWTVIPPPDLPTPEQVRAKEEALATFPDPPEDLQNFFKVDPDELPWP